MKTREVLEIALIVILLFLLLPESGVYNGLNKGVYVGNCGVEVWGRPGIFCGNYWGRALGLAKAGPSNPSKCS
jgi:hypothetical protein